MGGWETYAITVAGTLTALLIGFLARAAVIELWHRHTALGRLAAKVSDQIEEGLADMERRDD